MRKNLGKAMPNSSCVLVSESDMPWCCNFKSYTQGQKKYLLNYHKNSPL